MLIHCAFAAIGWQLQKLQSCGCWVESIGSSIGVCWSCRLWSWTASLCAASQELLRRISAWATMPQLSSSIAKPLQWTTPAARRQQSCRLVLYKQCQRISKDPIYLSWFLDVAMFHTNLFALCMNGSNAARSAPSSRHANTSCNRPSQVLVIVWGMQAGSRSFRPKGIDACSLQRGMQR